MKAAVTEPRPAPAHRVGSVLALLAGGAAVVFFLVTVLSAVDAPTHVARISVENPHEWTAGVEVTDAERDGWSGLGVVDRQAERTFHESSTRAVSGRSASPTPASRVGSSASPPLSSLAGVGGSPSHRISRPECEPRGWLRRKAELMNARAKGRSVAEIAVTHVPGVGYPTLHLSPRRHPDSSDLMVLKDSTGRVVRDGPLVKGARYSHPERTDLEMVDLSHGVEA